MGKFKRTLQYESEKHQHLWTLKFTDNEIKQILKWRPATIIKTEFSK